MALLRPIKPLPTKRTAAMLRAVMQRYGLTYRRVGQLMDRSEKCVSLYLLPDSSPNKRPIPKGCWELLLMKLQTIYHPDEPVEINL